MPVIVSKFDVPKMSARIALDADGFSEYVSWSQFGSYILNGHILTPFSSALKDEVRYSDKKRPKESVENTVDVDKYSFLITTSPTTKKPSYETVITEFENYITFLLEHYKSGHLRKEYRTLDAKNSEKEPFIALSLVSGKFNELIEENTKGKGGIKQSIEVVKPVDDTVPDMASVVINRDYGILKEQNAYAYTYSINLSAYNKMMSKSFKEMLLEDSVKALGNEPTELVALDYGFDRITFRHSIEPRVSVAYGSIVNAFIKEPTIKDKEIKLNKGSRIGDFRILKLITQGYRDKLLEKEIIDSTFFDIYDPKTREDEVFIRLYGIRDQLAIQKEMATSRSVEQNITMLPL